MHEARVLVVDDSAAMRALFSDILDQARNVRVIGTAANATEALEQIEALSPNVLTLDVEMPGMSGIELLEHLMESRPMPVVMLSSLTQTGTETSLKAFGLGAVECFPKPLKAKPEQFARTVGKLGKIVLAAANSNVRQRRRHFPGARHDAPFEWNGYLVALSAAMGGVEALSVLLAGYPPNCPPTVVVLQTELSVAEALAKRLDGELKCAVRMAKDGASLRQGTVHIAADPDHHAVVEPGSPPCVRLVARDPVDGVRPSANLLFGTLARAALPSVGAVLSGMGEDGAKGLKLMRDAGSRTFVQNRSNAIVAEAPAAALAADPAAIELSDEDLPAALLAACSRS